MNKVHIVLINLIGWALFGVVHRSTSMKLLGITILHHLLNYDSPNENGKWWQLKNLFQLCVQYDQQLMFWMFMPRSFLMDYPVDHSTSIHLHFDGFADNLDHLVRTIFPMHVGVYPLSSTFFLNKNGCLLSLYCVSKSRKMIPHFSARGMNKKSWWATVSGVQCYNSWTLMWLELLMGQRIVGRHDDHSCSLPFLVKFLLIAHFFHQGGNDYLLYKDIWWHT